MIRQNQQLGQKQTLNLSPQQIQLLNFIQLGTLELEERIENETLENPALENDASETDSAVDVPDNISDSSIEDNDFDRFEIIEQYHQDDKSDNTPDYSGLPEPRNTPSETYQHTLAQTNDFREQLKSQITVLPLSARERMLAGYIVDSLDDDGYLRVSITDLTDTLSFAHSLVIEDEEVEAALQSVQALDPVGIGARDLRECLLLQLKSLHAHQKSASTAIRIVQDHLQDLATHQYEKIANSLGSTLAAIRAAAMLIKKLNPHPVAGQTTELAKNHNIIPEFVIEKNEEGNLRVHLPYANSGALRVSSYMKETLQAMQSNKPKQQEKAAMQYLRSKVDSAAWFVEMLRQREHSMLVTMQAILQLQEEYFLSGDTKKLRPMILKDVAEIAQLDISTISRVTSLKYALTDFGTVHLKDLFQQGLAMADGGLVTNQEISDLIASLIAAEDKQHPASDQEICDVLREKGYTLARRTVAKYRDAMNIPIAKMRREMNA